MVRRAEKSLSLLTENNPPADLRCLLETTYVEANLTLPIFDTIINTSTHNQQTCAKLLSSLWDQ